MTNKINKFLAPSLLLTISLLVSPRLALAASTCDKVDNSKELKTCVQNNQIVKDLQIIINFLSAGVGIIIIAMIIVGGIQYSIAGDNPQATSAAKQRITNAFIALATYLLLFSFLQWLIPGGLFG